MLQGTFFITLSKFVSKLRAKKEELKTRDREKRASTNIFHFPKKFFLSKKRPITKKTFYQEYIYQKLLFVPKKTGKPPIFDQNFLFLTQKCACHTLGQVFWVVKV